MLIKHRNPEETEEGMTSASIKGCIQFLCLDWVHEDRIKTMCKVLNCLVQKGVILTDWFEWEVANVETFPMDQG